MTPWTLRKHPDPECDALYVEESGREVAVLFGSLGQKHARMIAATPDLYSALETAVFVLHDYERNDMGHLNTDVLNAIDEAYAALSKARSEES